MNSMRGYDRDEYEDLDEYEDDEEQEYEEADEDEYEVEEVRQPTEEELEYLELRQRLKESIRKQMKKELGTASGGSRDKMNAPRKDNYGSFFGPSQPVIAQRVIQESKSLLENPNLAARISKPNSAVNRKPVSSNSIGSKPQPNLPKATNALKKKVELLKNARDYSFLLSDDAEIPSSTKSPTNVSAPKSDARSAQLQSKSKQAAKDRGRDLPDSRDGKKQVIANGHSRPNVGLEKMAPASRLPMESRKQLGSNNASGPGRPIGPKGVPSKSPSPAVGKKVTQPALKNNHMASVRKPMPLQSGGQRPVQSGVQRPMQSGGQRPMQSGGQRPMQSGGQRPMQSGGQRPMQSGGHRPSSHMQSALSKHTLGQRREHQETNKQRVAPKSSLPSSRHEVRRPPPKLAARDALADQRPKTKPGKRPFADFDDEDDPINMIHKMFGYNRNKFQDDDDNLSDMETPFDQIQREEKRSSLIAKKEDEEEARLLEEEERRRRMHLAKKRKMGH